MRRVVLPVLSLALVCLGSGVPSQAGAIPLPGNATIRFPGHGWGHGRGMGQYGAKGMADRGVAYQDILKHYYAGISFATRAPETVRVLLQTSSDVLVTSAAAFTATSGSANWSSTSAQPYLRVTQANGTYTLWSGASSSRSGTWTKLAGTSASIVFKPGTQMLQFVQPSGTFRYYRGSITAIASGSSSVVAINVLPLEQYLAGVVPREMPASWPAEALRAQAIAARSYTVNKKLRATGSYDICTTTSCQVYGGYAYKTSATSTPTVLEQSASTSALNATAGRVMTVGGTPILAEYSSSTGGHSAPGTVSYESPVPDPDDSVSPNHNWTVAATASAIEKQWPSIGRLIALTVTKRDGYGDWGGRVLQLNVVGTTATQTVSGSTLASALGLKTDYFTIQIWNAASVQTVAPDSIPTGQNLPVRILLKNTGNTSWPLNGYVRIAAASSSLSQPDWISPTRPAAVSKDVTNTSRTWVPPGETGQFAFSLHTAGLSPGTYTQTFSAVADGVTTMNPTLTIKFTVAPPHTSIGMVDGNLWSLNTGFDGTPDMTFHYGLNTDIKLVGDWTGKGYDTPAVFRDGTWYLSNTFDGTNGIVVKFGKAGDTPIVGDWNGDGKDGIGVVRGNTFYLHNLIGPSPAAFKYGLSTDRPIAGDWNGDGTDGVGVVRGATFYLHNLIGPSPAAFQYGLSTDRSVVGDWNGDGKDTPGLVRGNAWYLSNGLTGHTDLSFIFSGGPGTAVAGKWQG